VSAPAVRPAGERGALVELDDNAAVHALAAALEPMRGTALEEIVPGDRTLLLVWHEAAPSPAAVEKLVADAGIGYGAPAGEAVELTVAYDGPDLEEVAAACAVGVEEFIARHSAAEYRVAFLGFAPGFAYLTGGDPGLAPPRRDEPRTRVPAGALAIAGPYSAIYPRESPGGWNLVGSCEARLFDPAQERPALLAAGAAVRLVPE
jgi:KipI family sensor histidine kinase inhibitor